MTQTTRLVAVLLAVGLAASFAVGGAPVVQELSQDDDAEATSQQTSYVRIVHASPDAPAVDVFVEGDEVLGDVEFGAVSDYLELPAGSYNVTITAADSPDTVVFEGAVELEARTATTIAASGELSEEADATAFAPVAFEDDPIAPGEEEAAIRVAHLSPDAPAVDVTVSTDDGTLVLADNVSFRNASDYVTVPAGEYTVDVRVATEENDGEVVASFDVPLAGGEAYTAMAVGYVDTDAAPADTPFGAVLTEDAAITLTVPSDEDGATPTEGMGNATETGGTETDEMGTETEMP